jgi:cytoplasmic iron level regulating protein YaaA (DUF328/UPF0246 family)
MIVLLSPAKRVNSNPDYPAFDYGYPHFLDKAELIMNALKKYSPGKLEKLQKINPDLARMNHERNQLWHRDYTPGEAIPAVYAFAGDAYLGLDAGSFDTADLKFAGSHLIILSGLYGALRATDLILPYRLEMGTHFSFRRNKNLYDFWTKDLTLYIWERIKESGSGAIINLSSAEYSKAIDLKELGVKVIQPDFKQYKEGKLIFMSALGKRARGMMARYIIKNRITDPEGIKEFAEDGYLFDENLSDDDKWTFTK